MKKILTVILICLFGLNAAMATVIKSVPADVKQSDGTTLTVTPFGDERVTWYRTIDDYTLMIADNHDFVYAIEDGKGGMKSSNVIAHNPQDRTQEEIAFLSSVKKKLFYSKEQVSLMNQYINAGIDYSKKVAKLKAGSDEVEDYKMVVILMSFKDYAFTTPKEDVDNLFNQVGYSKNGHPGSVHDFFVASSSGKLNLSATVLGPYVSDSNQHYYGKAADYANDLHVRELIREAVKKADPDIDYSEYINGDVNKYVSCVYVLYAGYSQAVSGNNADLIWPHRSRLLTPLMLDDVYIYDYGCSSELESYEGSNSPMKIGTICHEFSHVLGQPDYYDTDYETHGNAFNPGEWDLMAGGNYNGNSAFPPLWHAMERTVRNYVTLEDGIVGEDYTLEELGKSAKAIRLSYDGLPNEYFLLENRQQTGFDTYLPGHGLIIYKIDRNVSGWNNNCVNCDTSRLGFELITANTDKHVYSFWNGGYSYGQNQPFPGSLEVRSFSDLTTPSTKSYDGIYLNKPLYRISENENTSNITFHIGDTSNFVDIYDANFDFAFDTVVSTASLKANSLTITEKGFLYSDNSVPSEANSTKQIDNSSSNTQINVNLIGLNNNQTYYLRPYAKTASGISYGEIIQIKTPCASINSFPYYEDFTNGIEECWREENTVYVCTNWTVNDSNNAYIHSDYIWTGSEYKPQPQIKLITPPMDITVLDEPIVIFDHYQKTESYHTDNLKVYYKTSLRGSWVLLKEYTSQISNWQTDTIELPVKSQTLYIGFEAALKAGDGVYLDDVIVTDKNIASWPVVDFTSIENITDNGATFKANIQSSGFTNLVNKGFVLSTQSSPTVNDIVITSSDMSIGNYTVATNELESSTQYYVRAFAQNQGMISYSTEETFVTKCAKITDFPYTPDLTSVDTVCFDMQDKLILPILDLSNKDSMAIIYKATRMTDDASVHNVEVYYRDGVEGEWELLNTATEPDGQTITVDIPTLNHQSENAYIAFWGAGLSNEAYVLDNLEVKAVSQIAFVSTDSIYLTDYNKMYAQGTITYEGMTPVTQRGFVYSKHNNPTIADSKINSGNGSGTFNVAITNLEPLTTYYVRAFATNSYGTAYGQTMKITTPYIPIFNNTISSDQHLCTGSVPSSLNGSSPTGGNGTYEYLWISSNDGITWQPCDEGSVNDDYWYAPMQLFKTTYYRRVVTSYVSVDTSDIITITIDPASKGGNVFAMQDNVPQYQDAKFQLRAYVGDILYWQRLRPGYDWQEIDNSSGQEYLTDKTEDMGVYYYRATVKSGVCNAAVSGLGEVEVTYGVGFDGVNEDNNLAISPNPSSGTVFITANTDLNAKDVNIIVTDSKGAKVYSDNITLNLGDNVLGLENLPNGSYLVTIKGENIYKNIKLIISK